MKNFLATGGLKDGHPGAAGGKFHLRATGRRCGLGNEGNPGLTRPQLPAQVRLVDRSFNLTLGPFPYLQSNDILFQCVSMRLRCDKPQSTFKKVPCGY